MGKEKGSLMVFTGDKKEMEQVIMEITVLQDKERTFRSKYEIWSFFTEILAAHIQVCQYGEYC